MTISVTRPDCNQQSTDLMFTHKMLAICKQNTCQRFQRRRLPGYLQEYGLKAQSHFRHTDSELHLRMELAPRDEGTPSQCAIQSLS